MKCLMTWMKNLKKRRPHKRSGHAQTRIGCPALLLSFVFVALVFRIPGLKPAFKALDFGTARFALMLVWAVGWLVGVALIVFLRWLADWHGKRPRRK